MRSTATASAPYAPQGDCMDTDRTAPEDVGRHLVGLAGEAPAVVPIVVAPERLDRNPAAVYLAGKPSATGRRGLKRSLDRAAELLTSGRTKDAMAVDWTEVRYQHVPRWRTFAGTSLPPSTTCWQPSAVRKEVWRLGQIDADSATCRTPS